MSTLHITNGDCVRDTLRTIVSDPIAITADALHDGPAPAHLSGDEWRAVRARRLGSAGDDEYERALTESDRAIAEAPDYDEVILWFEHDLFDQLLLIRTLDLLAADVRLRPSPDVRLKPSPDVRLKPDTTAAPVGSGFSRTSLSDAGSGFSRTSLSDVASGFRLRASAGNALRRTAEALAEAVSRTSVSMICIGEFPGVQRFIGLGQLTAEQLASLLPQREPVSAAQYALAIDAWAAFRAPDPRGLVAVRDRLTLENGASALPFLGDALTRFFAEFPSVATGLSWTEETALHVLAGGSLSGLELFPAVQACETRPFMGDCGFFDLMRDLAATRVPLVTIDGGDPRIDERRLDLRHSSIAITAAGRDVLAGRANAVSLNGIDRGVAGPTSSATARSGIGIHAPKRWYHESVIRGSMPEPKKQPPRTEPHGNEPPSNDRLHASTSEAVTKGVRVEVESQYAADQSQPFQQDWFFYYTIRITNEGPKTVQLLSRHWIITDAAGHVEEVKGPGVVGEQPVLAQGKSFHYTSGCRLKTSTGVMHGTYQMVTADGDHFDIEIAPFALHEPYTVH